MSESLKLLNLLLLMMMMASDWLCWLLQCDATSLTEQLNWSRKTTLEPKTMKQNIFRRFRFSGLVSF